jgi:hypothetical protein
MILRFVLLVSLRLQEIFIIMPFIDTPNRSILSNEFFDVRDERVEHGGGDGATSQFMHGRLSLLQRRTAIDQTNIQELLLITS